jgi:hypothetical protein
MKLGCPLLAKNFCQLKLLGVILEGYFSKISLMGMKQVLLKTFPTAKLVNPAIIP